MARVRCIRCQRATTRDRSGICDACRGPAMASRTCPRCHRHNGLLTRAADSRFLCAECCAEVATMPSSVLVREPPALMDSDDAPSSVSMPRCPLHPDSELIRTRMRDGSTRWTCSERNHDIENNWALCLPECKDNHGDTSLVDLFDDGRFECRNPQCPLVQQRRPRRAATEVVERKSEFCLACMDTEPAMESKCPNGHISYCAECLPHLNPRQCGQCRMPIARPPRAVSPPPPPRRQLPPLPPARRITSLCLSCRQVLRSNPDNHGFWECTNARCAFGRSTPTITIGICQDCGGRTYCFGVSAGVSPRCANPNCTAPLLDAPLRPEHDVREPVHSDSPPVFVAPPLSDILPGPIMMNCSRCGTYGSLTARSSRGPWLCASCSRDPLLLTGVVVPLPRSARRLDFDSPDSPTYDPSESVCEGCRATGQVLVAVSSGQLLCHLCRATRVEPEENEDQAAAMVRLLGPQRRRPREQQPPTEEDKKELESKQQVEEEPAPQRRRLRHLWLYFGTEPRGVRPARGFVDGDIIISMREAPTMELQEILALERARIDVQFAMTSSESFAIVTLYQTEANGGAFSNLTIDCIFDVPLDANSFIDSENVRLRYDESQQTIRYSNHAYTELFTLLARDAQLQRRTERTLRDLGFTSPSS